MSRLEPLLASEKPLSKKRRPGLQHAAVVRASVDPWLTVPEAARVCGISLKRIRAALVSRELGFKRTGDAKTSAYLIPYSWLDRWRQQKFPTFPALD